MSRLTYPLDILRRQGEPREEFDLDQINDLYDGCVAEFDDEVGKMLAHLEASGLARNTIVVVYSDHGMELFEASRIPIATIADYLHDPEAYDPEASWQRAMRDVVGEADLPAFAIFAAL